jgi:hypothetical protein
MAIDYDPGEYIAALGDISSLLGKDAGLGSANIANLNNVGVGGNSFLGNIVNILKQQQGPQLGPDDFGSYVIPASDPTYTSGFDYARSIAGGIPMSQVIAPGVSYSPEQPGGYTQAQLGPTITDLPNVVTETPPDDPRYLGRGIGGVNIPVDRDMKMPPLRDIFGGRRDTSSLENLLNIGKLFSGGIDQDAIDKIVQERIAESMPTFEQPDFSQFVRKEDIPTLIPPQREILERPMISGLENRDLMDADSLITGVPTGRDFSIEDIRRDLDLPDFSQFARQEDIPTIPTFEQPDLSGFVRQEDIPTFDPDVLKQDILMSLPQTQVPDVSKFVTQDDITKAIAGIDMPTFQQPDLSAYDTRIAELEQQLAGLKQPTGGRFSIDQQLPMGLF